MAGLDHRDCNCIAQRLASDANFPRLVRPLIPMYHTILVPVENRESDQTILRHIRQLAKLTRAKLTLVHVADGWAARNFERFQLQESEEMKQDREYLAAVSEELRAEGYEVATFFVMGAPATEIIKLARAEPIDLI